MSHRYNTIDIIVGVGMCAIVFGVLLIFLAANGTYQIATPQPISFEQPVGIELGWPRSSRPWVKPLSTRRSSNAEPISSWPNLHSNGTGRPSLTKSSNRSRAVPWEPSCARLPQSQPTIWPGSSTSWDERL